MLSSQILKNLQREQESEMCYLTKISSSELQKMLDTKIIKNIITPKVPKQFCNNDSKHTNNIPDKTTQWFDNKATN